MNASTPIRPTAAARALLAEDLPAGVIEDPTHEWQVGDSVRVSFDNGETRVVGLIAGGRSDRVAVAVAGGGPFLFFAAALSRWNPEGRAAR